MKIYLVKQESYVDGEYLFNVVPCKDLATAQAVLREEKETLLTEGHFAEAKDYIEGRKPLEDCTYKWSGGENVFYIEDLCDDYSEFIEIEEKTLK